ncbi:hypothetical protein SALBM311S_07566 [Streptomyces alboniger]
MRPLRTVRKTVSDPSAIRQRSDSDSSAIPAVTGPAEVQALDVRHVLQVVRVLTRLGGEPGVEDLLEEGLGGEPD